ncbi:conserved hypothetical protein [Weissella viridescens]|jgi:hypothetical protein|nr:DUF4044 domain-containing protein [Weissella viridescens]MBX4172745.1 DUF4044 domain-containing protein [Weissella viridescens]MCB6840339.1 DUF4044 domain-containing protein [Weissella viridescens]MCB6847072.1 DUF4044 domain-containing protein [Weissella viridescens]QOD86502.1 DUF4044 domain-containing protein [Weissella viridescens]WJI91633.1 DUF4044 domain-containing protein [Weissella viridescens]
MSKKKPKSTMQKILQAFVIFMLIILIGGSFLAVTAIFH